MGYSNPLAAGSSARLGKQYTAAQSHRISPVYSNHQDTESDLQHTLHASYTDKLNNLRQCDAPRCARRTKDTNHDQSVGTATRLGVFDNVPDALLVEQISSINGCTDDLVKIQQCCNSIAFLARQLSRDENFLSPFAKNARRSGYADVSGGKEDDVTVLLAAVNLGNNYNNSSR